MIEDRRRDRVIWIDTGVGSGGVMGGQVCSDRWEGEEEAESGALRL